MEENINLLGIDLLSGIDNKIIDIDTKDVSLFSPLILAYIGDAVYELIIRTHIVIKGNRPVNKLHKDSASLVKAKTQASFGKLLKDELNDKELSIYKRGRNAKSHTMAKNSTVSDYRYATAFEALIGYLYLDNKLDRAIYLVSRAMFLYESTYNQGEE
jgi:hypothetical protein